jgi:class 3 adenylate cyclase
VSQIAGDLEAGREASERFAWREAFDLLSRADRNTALTAQDLERLAEAAWWTARLDVCIAARERAFTAHMTAGATTSAGSVAMELAKNHYARGASAIASGWLGRAERLLAADPESLEHGYLARLHAVLAFEGQGDFDSALAHADRALAIGTRLGDLDLQALALHDRGRVLIAMGRVAEGQALLDEATVAAVAGELRPMTTGVIYCNVISSCEERADYRRAGEWTEAARRWCDRQAISGFPGLCRVHRASILRVHGVLPEAEREARRACDELSGFNVSYQAAAFYELGEIRFRIGDFVAAEQAFRQAHGLGKDPEPGLSLLHLARGETDAAATRIRTALADESLGPLIRAKLLPAQVEIALAAGHAEAARAAAQELESIAASYGTPALRAHAEAARGAVSLDEGDGDNAVRRLRLACRLWQEVDAPYETARVRMLLAEAYRACGDTAAARLEIGSARATFERLGADIDARRAVQRLGGNGSLPEETARPATRTFMFTDVAKSTRLVEALGDQAWKDVLRWHDDTLRSLFAAHGGEEVDHAGDGFFVAFERSSAALECAVAIQRALATHRRQHGFATQVRIGLHSATAERDGRTYRGMGVHEAARIAAFASADEIVASEATVTADGTRYPMSEPLETELEGLSHPVRVVKIDWR